MTSETVQIEIDGYFFRGSEDKTAAIKQFAEAWKSAGKPPVEQSRHTASGYGGGGILWSHSDVMATIGQGDRCTDDGRFVFLEWDFTPTVFGATAGSGSLSFDRESPIKRGC